MNATTALTIATILAVTLAVGNAYMKSTASRYKDDPASPYYNSAVTREGVSDNAKDIAEREQQMMDKTRAGIDRNADALQRQRDMMDRMKDRMNR